MKSQRRCPVISIPVIVANEGDNLIVHFYNTENGTERDSFKIDAQPYTVNVDVGGGESGNATFTAQQPSIYPSYCIYLLPTIQGQLVIGAIAEACSFLI